MMGLPSIRRVHIRLAGYSTTLYVGVILKGLNLSDSIYRIHNICTRAYHLGNTSSRRITEVKQS